ncbi:MAG: acetyl-CoA hydrolase/transferase C-terminal domain-containing protein [Syntrophobacteraceae bacterium]
MASNYVSEYRQKLVSAEEAATVVRSGDWVAYGHFAMAPRLLDEALAKRKDDLRDVKVRCVCPLQTIEVAKVDPKYEHFIYHSSFLSPYDRKLGDRCMHIAGMYHNGPATIRNGHASHSRVFFLKTAPMDNHGFFNFGTSCSYHRALCDVADQIVVEVNNKVPVCLGGEQENVHISEVTHVVESDNYDMPVFPQDIPATDVQKSIATHIVEELEDGCTLQLGIGGLANYVGKILAESDLKDLGVHSEMMCDAFVDLFEKGKITGCCKTRQKYKMVYTFALGSQRLYDFLDNNPACAIYPVDICNNPESIGRNYKQVAINNALMVDIYGQVSSESVNFQQISGTGGQVDFTSGAWLSKGGKAFICMPSTRLLKDGRTVSRIVPFITPGNIVTAPRAMPMFIVTEYGKANITGKSVWQRAEMLINIAHPDFRDDLIKDAQKQKIWTMTNKIE